MIKLSTMTSVCPDWQIQQIIDAMLEFGYEGLEPRTGWNHASGIEPDMTAADRDSVRGRMSDSGLCISCISTGARFAVPDDSEAATYLEEAKNAIVLARDLGAPYIRTFGGDRGDGEVYGMVGRTADRYMRIVDFAAEHDVTVLMETHDSWCVSAQVRAVVERVSHPNLQVLWDIMHPQRFMERPAETMANIGVYTKHLHAHDGEYTKTGKTRVTALGSGLFDHSEPLELLTKAGFSGHCSVEIIHKPGSDHDARGVLAQYGAALKQMI